MTTKIDQKEYLKKYLSSSSDKKKKKKKIKSVGKTTVKIIDDNIDFGQIEDIADNDLEFTTNEDAPQIVGVIDDRPPELRAKDFINNKKWKVVNNDNGFESSLTVTQEGLKDQDRRKFLHKASQENSPDLSPKRKYPDESSNKRVSRSPDLSPKRKKRTSDISPRRRNNSPDMSPKRRNRSPDMSPRRRNRSPDKSPKRRNRSPVKLPRRRNRSPDISPKRRNRSIDKSPRRRNHSPDISPRRRNRSPDISLRRNRSTDISPRRRNRSPDMSPRSRNRSPGKSPPRRRNRSPDISPRRPNRQNHSPDVSRGPRRNISRSTSRSKEESRRSLTPTKMKKTLDGKVAGLQNARLLRMENDKFKKREDELFKNMNAEVSGKNAQVVMRDKKTGRIRDRELEARQEQTKNAEDNKRKEIYTRWGKGVKQVDEYENRLHESQKEMDKPLARYADDSDLDSLLRNRERIGDPMLLYLKSKEQEKRREAGVPERPVYKGWFPDNRFNIRPGYRWDGVDRSNGYEKRYFEMISKKQAGAEEAYRYSTEDM